MQKQTFLLAGLGLFLLSTIGCRGVEGPDLGNRESVQQQRDRASGNGGQLPFDPFPATDVGPGSEDFRPRDFSTPRARSNNLAFMGQAK